MAVLHRSLTVRRSWASSQRELLVGLWVGGYCHQDSGLISCYQSHWASAHCKDISCQSHSKARPTVEAVCICVCSVCGTAAWEKSRQLKSHFSHSLKHICERYDKERELECALVPAPERRIATHERLLITFRNNLISSGPGGWAARGVPPSFTNNLLEPRCQGDPGTPTIPINERKAMRGCSWLGLWQLNCEFGAAPPATISCYLTARCSRLSWKASCIFI